MKTGRPQSNNIIYVIISKKYKVQAFSRNEEYALGFADMLGGNEHCYIIQTLEEKLEVGQTTLQNNMLFEWQGIWLTSNLDMEVTEFLETKEGDMAGCMHQMMDLIEYYKFSDEEIHLVNRFVEVYDYYFVRDVHGLTAYEINEEIDYKALIKMYLTTVRRNS